eukprot:COSAG01_NODE_1513_length_10065_cov_63.160144_6_plen_123_part_00
MCLAALESMGRAHDAAQRRRLGGSTSAASSSSVLRVGQGVGSSAATLQLCMAGGDLRVALGGDHDGGQPGGQSSRSGNGPAGSGGGQCVRVSGLLLHAPKEIVLGLGELDAFLAADLRHRLR